MKSVIKIGIILFIGCMLVSCKPTTIKGKAINPINGKGIEGVAISAQTNTWELPGGAKTKEKVVSDANGNFVLQYKGEAQISVSVGTNYYPVGWHLNGETVKGITPERGEATHADYYAVPYGKYQLKINNVNCGGVNDTIIINQTNQVGSFLGNDWILSGCNGYTTSWDNVPMGNIHTVYTVIRGGFSNTYIQDFEVIPNQNNILVISY